MNKEKINQLLKRYLEGESSLDEEEKFFKAEGHAMHMWSTYVKAKRKKAPANLNNSIWVSIQGKRRKSQRFLYALSGVAASIALFIGVAIFNLNKKDTSYAEKQALLNEALSMFPDQKQILPKKNIIYEDEMIIIYKAP